MHRETFEIHLHHMKRQQLVQEMFVQEVLRVNQKERLKLCNHLHRDLRGGYQLGVLPSHSGGAYPQKCMSFQNNMSMNSLTPQLSSVGRRISRPKYALVQVTYSRNIVDQRS